MATDFELAVMKELGDIKSTTAKTAQAVEDLSGPQGRVTKLESAANRQFWYTVAVVPIIGGLHAFARKFGVDV